MKDQISQDFDQKKMDLKLNVSQSPKILRKIHLKSSSNSQTRENSTSGRQRKTIVGILAKYQKPNSTSARNYQNAKKQKEQKNSTGKIFQEFLSSQKIRKKLSENSNKYEMVKQSSSFHQQASKPQNAPSIQNVKLSSHQQLQTIPYSQLLSQANEIKQKIKQMSAQAMNQTAKLKNSLSKTKGLNTSQPKIEQAVLEPKERHQGKLSFPENALSPPQKIQATNQYKIKRLMNKLSIGLNKEKRKVQKSASQTKPASMNVSKEKITKPISNQNESNAQISSTKNLENSMEKSWLNLSALTNSSRNQSFQSNNLSLFSVRAENNQSQQNNSGFYSFVHNLSNAAEKRADQNISFSEQLKKLSEFEGKENGDKRNPQPKKMTLQTPQKFNESFKEKYDTLIPNKQPKISQQSENSTCTSFSILKDLKSDIKDVNSEQNSFNNSILSSSTLTLHNKDQIQVLSAKNHSKEQIKLIFQKLKLPTNASIVLQQFKDQLTMLEQNEIIEYPQIYCIGIEAQKIRNNISGNENHGFDDERGDMKIVLRDHIAYRYEIIEILGKGSFGQVVKAFDYKRKEYCALKIIRNKKRFHHQAAIEVKILSFMKEKDQIGVNNVIHIKNYFVFRKHLCITFELLSINLYEVIKKNNFQGLSMGLIRRFAIQLIQALKFLSQYKIVHCDLKPENILLKQSARSYVKIIDFGSSCFEDDRVYTYIQSRFYRAPEVILGLPYDMNIDMWSLGCILGELHSGYPLFPGENEVEQLLCMMEILGVIDEEMVIQSPRKKLFFDSNNQPKLVPNSRGRKRIPGTKTLSYAVKNFINRCLIWLPSRRMSPEEALNHKWIQEGISKHPQVTQLNSKQYRQQKASEQNYQM